MNAIPFAARVEEARPFCPVPMDQGRSGQPAPPPLEVVATPYVWRDPTTIKPREWVYGRSIQRGHVRAIIAPGSAGKTILSVGEALAMATGRNLLGQEVPGGPKRVWLWNLEDDGDELARIIQAACKHWSIGPEHIRDRLFVDSALEGAILKLATSTAAEGLTINRPLVAGMTDEMLARGIDYLHVDPFVSSHSANENDNGEIDAIAKEWALVAKNAKAGIGLAHHVSKAGAAEVTAMSGRGAVALINACRSVLVINRMSEDEAKRYGIEEEKRRRYFRTYDDKNNRAPPSDKSDWFTMASISLNNGQIDEGDNMGVVIPWSPPDAFEGMSVDHLRQVQAVIATGEYKAHHSAADWAGNAIAEVLGLNIKNPSDRVRVLRMLNTWIENDVLRIEERKDDNRQRKKFVVVGRAADDHSATPDFSVASQGVAAEPSSATLHPSPYKGGSVAVADGGGGKASYCAAGNPALGAVPRQPVLTPDERFDDDVPGMEGFGK
jgi:hypothetical protein